MDLTKIMNAVAKTHSMGNRSLTITPPRQRTKLLQSLRKMGFHLYTSKYDPNQIIVRW